MESFGDPVLLTQEESNICMQIPNHTVEAVSYMIQGSHRLEKCLNLEGFLEKSLKIKSALKSTGKSLKCLEKYFL